MNMIFGLLVAYDAKINTLAGVFSKTSSSENYSPKFKNIKQQKEKRNLKFSSDNSETYNQSFSLSWGWCEGAG